MEIDMPMPSTGVRRFLVMPRRELLLPASRGVLCAAVAVCGGMLAAADLSKQVDRDGKPPASEWKGVPLVFFDNFTDETADRGEQSDPKAWKIADQKGNRVYSQFQQSKVETPVRSPFNRALVKDLVVGDFVLDVKLQSTIKEYDHRDMCLFFGFQ